MTTQVRRGTTSFGAVQVVEAISHEGLRMLLREEGVTFQRISPVNDQLDLGTAVR
jgi:hypothetical protein